MSSPAGVEGVSRSESVRMWLLGGFRGSVGSTTIAHDAWRLRKAEVLVKLLAISPGHRLHREQAMDLLWPESGRKKATNNLRNQQGVRERGPNTRCAEEDAAPVLGDTFPSQTAHRLRMVGTGGGGGYMTSITGPVLETKGCLLPRPGSCLFSSATGAFSLFRSGKL